MSLGLLFIVCLFVIFWRTFEMVENIYIPHYWLALLICLVFQKDESDHVEASMVLVGKLLTFLSLKKNAPKCIFMFGHMHFVHIFISAHAIAVLFWPGSLDFLEKPTVAFVRLKEATALDSALEAPVPICFVLVLIGPGKADMDYHETGRALAALMADKVSRIRVLIHVILTNINGMTE